MASVPSTKGASQLSTCEEIFGFHRDAGFSYEDFLSSLHPDDLPLVDAAIAHALDSNGTGHMKSTTASFIPAEPRAGSAVKAKRFSKSAVESRPLFASLGLSSYSGVPEPSNK